MTITAGFIVLNEEDYIQYSLRSIYPYVDEIIIVHGSTQYAGLTNSMGLSIDNTHNKIQEFIENEDMDGKVIYEVVGKRPTKTQLRNKYIELATKDWILVVDGDELYTKEDIDRLKDYVANDPELVHIFYPQHWFWKDFKHVCVIDEEKVHSMNKFITFQDKNGKYARQGQYHERFFKNRIGFKHRGSHSVVTDESNRDVYIDGFYQNKRIFAEDVHRYHYGYIKKKKNLEERVRYYGLRDKGLKEVDTAHDGYLNYLKTGEFHNPVYKIVPFEGDHPEVIKSHPFYGLNVNQL